MAQSASKSRTPLVTFLLVLAVLLFVILKMLAPYALALFLGGTLALLSYPIYKRFLRWKFGPKTAATIVTLGVLLVVIAPLCAFGIAAVREATELGNNLQEQGFSLKKLGRRVTGIEPVKSALKETPGAKQQLTSGAQSAAKAGVAYMLKLVKTIPEMLMQLALAGLACFFLLLDGKRFFNWLLNKIPLEEDIREKLVESSLSTTVATVWGGFAAAGTQAVIIFLAYLLLGIPAAFLAGGVTFVLAWIPVLGSMPTSVIGVVYLHFQDEPVKMGIMIAIGVATGLIDNVVRAWVLKGREEMHPFIGLIAIIAGIDMFGIFGVFIGPILVAILISLLDVWPAIGDRYHLTSGTKTNIS